MKQGKLIRDEINMLENKLRRIQGDCDHLVTKEFKRDDFYEVLRFRKCENCDEVVDVKDDET